VSEGRRLIIPGAGAAPAADCYARFPEHARRGVVVLHEILGPQPEIDRVVDRFAAAGYAAVAPDLFGRGLLPLCIYRAVKAIHSGRGAQIDQIVNARQWLCDRTGVPLAAVGLIGFCLGGGFALAAGRGWGAVSTNYGDIPPDDVLDGVGPVIGCYGGRDRLFGKHGAMLAARLRPRGVPVEIHEFPEVGHSFLTDGRHPIATTLSRPLLHIEYNPAVAEEAWRRIFSFFDRHL
jgi:carboxymethylenebutenolidase